MSAVISTAAAIVSAAVSAAARRWRRCSTLRSGSTLRDRDVQLFTVEFVPIVKARSRLRGVRIVVRDHRLVLFLASLVAINLHRVRPLIWKSRALFHSGDDTDSREHLAKVVLARARDVEPFNKDSIRRVLQTVQQPTVLRRAFSLLEFLRFTRAAPLTALPPRKVGVVTLIAPPIRVRIKLLVPRPSSVAAAESVSPLAAASIVPSSIAPSSIAIVPSIVPSIAMPPVAIASSIVPSIVPRPVPPPASTAPSIASEFVPSPTATATESRRRVLPSTPSRVTIVLVPSRHPSSSRPRHLLVTSSSRHANEWLARSPTPPGSDSMPFHSMHAYASDPPILRWDGMRCDAMR